MRVVALGTSAAYPGANNACTGWLVQEQDTNLLIDCGTGVLSQLQRFLPLTDITAIVISHMHADHFIDLIPLRYAYQYALKPSRADFAVYLPPGGRELLAKMVMPLTSGEEADFFAGSFAVGEYDPVGRLQIGPLKLQFAPGIHYVPSWGISVEGSGKVVFTADTGPSETIEALAKEADLLVAEATYLSVEEDRPAPRGHLTAREAGELAARAKPKRVLLTHLWPYRDPLQALDQARQAFRGSIALAEPGSVYEV